MLVRVFPRIIAGGDYFSFRTKRGRLFKGGDNSRVAIISNIAHWKSCLKYYIILFIIFPLNQKIITPDKLNMGFLSVPNLVS